MTPSISVAARARGLSRAALPRSALRAQPPKAPASPGAGSGGPLSRPAPARGPGGANLAARRRPTSTRAAGDGGQGINRGQPGILRFYSDDAPGLKIGPTTVLVSSLVFIGCVVILHIWGKFRGTA